MRMRKRTTKFYRKNEAEVMKRLGLKPTKNSGAGWIEKCDGENEHFICELKSTDKESYRIEQSTLHVLEYHANVSHKIPIFALQFLNTDEVWVMMKPEDIDITEFLKNGVDNNQEECYNKTILQESQKQDAQDIVLSKNKESLNARQRYIEQRERERTNKEKQMKEKQKTRRKEQREWHKSNSSRKA